MEVIRQKSTCCAASVRRFGGKRRQCAACKRTWRIRPARRGPKVQRSRQRAGKALLEEYRTNIVGSIAAWAAGSKQLPRTMQKRAARARDRVILAQETDCVHTCLEPHILLADALVQRFKGKEYTTYLILVRSLTSDKAQVCCVRTIRGCESGAGWQAAFMALPAAMKEQTAALVCDGHRGLTGLAQRYGWTLQRCCFHVLKELNKNMRLWRKASPEVYTVHELVHTVLESADDEKVMRTLDILTAYTYTTPRKEVASIIRGLVRHFRDYRSYIYHAELHLPATNNTCECSFRRVRAIQSKARGWRTPQSHTAWVRYILTSTPHIHCREGIPR